MWPAIGDLLPSAVGVALSPVPIIAVILMLGTPKARSNGPAFAVGWVAGLVIDQRDRRARREADWPAFLSNRAPQGAPNVLVVLYDDAGQAAWSPYGGRINMPTMDRLAANGLTYGQ